MSRHDDDPGQTLTAAGFTCLQVTRAIASRSRPPSPLQARDLSARLKATRDACNAAIDALDATHMKGGA